MEFDKWIQLVRELVWPAVALVLAPTVIRQLGDLAKLVDALKSTEFVAKALDAAQKVREAMVEIDKASNELNINVGSLKDNVGSLKAQIQAEDLSKFLDGLTSQSQRKDVEEILSEKRLPPAETSPEELYKEMESSWEDLNKVLGAKLKSIGKPFDARYSLGTSVAPLIDGRRSHPLSKNDAEFIANLHSQYRRFASLQSTKKDWLTPDVSSTFVAGVEAAKKLIGQTA